MKRLRPPVAPALLVFITLPLGPGAPALFAQAQAATQVREQAAATAAWRAPWRTRLPRLPREPAYWWARALGTRARNPSRALLVSRVQFRQLRPFRSWQDMAALRDYVTWADRPEAAAFHDGQVIADVSENDLILLRVPAAAVEASVPVLRDPIGYAVLDPPARGLVKIAVKIRPWEGTLPDLPPSLATAPVPIIDAAVSVAPSIVTIYGGPFAGRHVKVYSRKGPGQLLYVGRGQINAKLPSLDQVAVEVDGLRSDWAEVAP